MNLILLFHFILNLWQTQIRTAALLSREADRTRSERQTDLLCFILHRGLAQLALLTLRPARPRPSAYKNSVPIILSDFDPKFNSVVKLMSELRQFHPSLRVSKVQELKNNRFLVIGDTPRDVAILQSDNKMKACLGQNVSASLPKAYQTTKRASKTLVVKGVPTEVSEKDFKEFLDLNKIIYPKAERLTSKKDGRVLQMFKLEIKDEAEAEALISQHLTCHITGIIYKVEEFRSPVSVKQCWNCQSFGHSAKTSKCLICGESHNHKGCPNREKAAKLRQL